MGLETLLGTTSVMVWNRVAFHPSKTFSFWCQGRIQPLLDICRNGFVTPVHIVPLYWGPFQWALFKLRQVLSPRPKKSGNAIARAVQNFFASALDPLGHRQSLWFHRHLVDT